MTDIIRQSRGQCHCLRVQRGTQRPCASGRPQPGPAAGAGSNGKPFSTQGRAAARVGPPVTRRPPGPLPTGLGLPPAARRGRRPRGVGTAARRPPGQTAGSGSGGKPHPPSAGVVAHGVGTAARHPPGQTAGGGSGGKPHPRKAGPPPV